MTTAEVELRVTEMALRLLTDEISSPSTESPSGAIHECSVCGARETWGPHWRWFGSYRDMENCKCLKTCSRECFEKVCRMEVTDG